MQKFLDFFNNQDIRKRLCIWFLLIALIPLGWTIFISYEVSKNNIYNLVRNQLRVFIFRQGQLLEYYFKEKEHNALDIVKQITNQGTLAQLKGVLAHKDKDSILYKDAEKIFRPLIESRLKGLKFHNLLILTPNSEIAFSALPSSSLGSPITQIESYAPLAKYLDIAKNTHQSQLASIILPVSPIKLLTYIILPLFDEDELVGFALVELDNTLFYRLLSDYNELVNKGGLGEMLILAQTENQLFSISATTSSKGLTQLTIDPKTPFGVFAHDLLDHEILVANIVNYEDEQSLVVGKHFFPDFNWALAIKIKLSQLYAPVYKLRMLFWILAILTTIAVIMAATYTAEKIASPILALTRKTQLLAAGDLSQRIDISSKDEIGRLGASFNEMATQLDQMIRHLDALVAKRTREYEVQNKELQVTIKELEKTQDRLITQEKLASLGALTAGIAHEIKNPLNFINNFAELCSQIERDLEKRISSLQSLLPKEEMEEISNSLSTLKLDIDKIYEHGKRADSIVRNMLQHSRAIPGQEEVIDIHPLLEEYISLSYHGMRAQDQSFNVKIVKDFDPTLPQIPVVPQELSRVFLNLLSNAYYSVLQKAKQHPTNYSPTVKITTENHQDFIVIKFWDNGVGIPADVLLKLFTPFFTTKPPGEGTGLGLSLSYNLIVQGHHGTLTAASEPGEYAEFTITLPIRQ